MRFFFHTQGKTLQVATNKEAAKILGGGEFYAVAAEPWERLLFVPQDGPKSYTVRLRREGGRLRGSIGLLARVAPWLEELAGRAFPVFPDPNGAIVDLGRTLRVYSDTENNRERIPRLTRG